MMSNAFIAALRAAGIDPAELHASFTPDGVQYADDVPQATRDIVDHLYATTPPDANVPQQVPMWAAQAALKQVGKYEPINAFILALENTNPPVFFAWTMGNFASRQSQFIATLAARFDMTPDAIDAVFVLADQIATVAG